MMQIAVTQGYKLTNQPSQPSHLTLPYSLDLSAMESRQQGTARSLYPYKSKFVPLIQDDALVIGESSEANKRLGTPRGE